MCHRKSKMSNLSLSDVFFKLAIHPKLVFGLGSAPDLARGTYDAPPNPLVGWGGGHPILYASPQRL